MKPTAEEKAAVKRYLELMFEERRLVELTNELGSIPASRRRLAQTTRLKNAQRRRTEVRRLMDAYTH